MKRLILIFTSCIITTLLIAQSKEKALSTKSITFYGLDFSNARFIGFDDFKYQKSKIVDYFTSWNTMIMSDPQKFDISKYFEIANVTNDFQIVSVRNKAVDAANIYLEAGDESYALKKEDISKIILDYNSSKEGYGLVFIVEQFDKSTEKSEIWVTYFDIQSREVMYTKRITGTASGDGMRTYWTNAVFATLKNVLKYKDKWK